MNILNKIVNKKIRRKVLDMPEIETVIFFNFTGSWNQLM